MPARKGLEKAVTDAAQSFAMTVIEAVRGSTLEELIALQGGESPKRRGRKPGPKPKARKKPGRKPKTAKRLSRADKAKVLDTIVSYLRKNPASKTPAVAKSVGIPSRKAGLYLKELRTKGRVTARGKKVKMVYSAKAGTAKKKTKAKKVAKKKKVAGKKVTKKKPAKKKVAVKKKAPVKKAAKKVAATKTVKKKPAKKKTAAKWAPVRKAAKK